MYVKSFVLISFILVLSFAQAMEQPTNYILLKALVQKVEAECKGIEAYSCLGKELVADLFSDYEWAQTAAFGIWQVPSGTVRTFVEPCLKYYFERSPRSSTNEPLSFINQSCKNYVDLQCHIADHLHTITTIAPFKKNMVFKILTYLPKLHAAYSINNITQDMHVEVIKKYESEMRADLFFNTISKAAEIQTKIWREKVLLQVASDESLFIFAGNIINPSLLFKLHADQNYTTLDQNYTTQKMYDPCITNTTFKAIISDTSIVEVFQDNLIITDFESEALKRKTVYIHTKPVSALTVSSDKKLLASADESSLIKILDLTQNLNVPEELIIHELQLPQKDRYICHLAFTHDNKKLISVTSKTVYVWDLESKKFINIFKDQELFYEVRISADNKYLFMLISPYNDCKACHMKVISIDDSKEPAIYYRSWNQRSYVQKFILSPCNQFIIYASKYNQEVSILHCLTGKYYMLYEYGEPNHEGGFNPSMTMVNNNLFIAHGDGFIHRWKLFNQPIPEIHFKNMLNFAFLNCLLIRDELIPTYVVYH